MIEGNKAKGDSFEKLALAYFRTDPKFQNIKTRAAIKDLLNKKYDAVLVRYGKELTIMKDLFENNRDKPPISKNMPPKAGSIAWARSIMGRIKAPIKKFKSKSDQLMSK